MNLTELRALVAAGGVVDIPAGVHVLDMTSTVGLNLSNVTLRGTPGATRLVFTGPTGEYRQMIAVGDNVTLEGLVVERAGMFNAIGVRVNPTSGLTIRQCQFIGGSAPSQPGFAHLFEAANNTGTTLNVRVERSTVSGWDYGWFQNNDAHGTVDGVVFDDCTFVGNFLTDLEFNAPTGITRNVTVNNCRFHSTGGWGVGLARVATASITGCTFAARTPEAVHIEDGTTDALIQHCSFVTTGAHSVHVLSGSQRVKLLDNTFDMSAAPADSASVLALYAINAPTASGLPVGAPVVDLTMERNRQVGARASLFGFSVDGLRMVGNVGMDRVVIHNGSRVHIE